MHLISLAVVENLLKKDRSGVGSKEISRASRSARLDHGGVREGRDFLIDGGMLWTFLSSVPSYVVIVFHAVCGIRPR